MSPDHNEPSEAEVRAALERALASPSLSRSPRLRRFLAFVVEAALAGRGGELDSRRIWTQVFEGAPGRDVTAVRVSAGRLRAALKDYYASWGVSDPLRIEIPTGSYAPRFSRAAHALARKGRAGGPLEHDALLDYVAFQDGYRLDLWLRAEASAHSALRGAPDSALAHALLADLQYGALLLDLAPRRELLERWDFLARRALAIDPRCEMGRLALAGLHFVTGEPGAFRAEAELALSLDPGNVLVTGSAGFLLALDGEWKLGRDVIDGILATGQPFPRWQRILPFLDHYRAGEHEAALAQASGIAMPGFYWQPLLEAAALARLGHRREAAGKAEALRSLLPGFEASGRSVLTALIPDPSLASHLASDLRSAGLALV